MPTNKGTAIIWGCSTTGLTFTGAAGDYTVTGEDFGKEATEVTMKDRTGATKSAYYYDGVKNLSLTVYPSGASADATATPEVGATVTVASSTDADLNGNWICTAASKTRSNESHVEFSLTLKKFDGFTPS